MLALTKAEEAVAGGSGQARHGDRRRRAPRPTPNSTRRSERCSTRRPPPTTRQLSATELAGRVRQLRVPDAAFDSEPDVEEIADLLPTADIAARAAFHPHESSWLMWVPLVVLAALSVVGGLINLPFTHSLKRLEIWLEPSLFEHEAHLGVDGAGLWVLAIVAVAIGIVGIAGAYFVYIKSRVDPARSRTAACSRTAGTTTRPCRPSWAARVKRASKPRPDSIAR